MDSRAQAIIARHNQLVSGRGIWNTHWQEIAERVLPRMSSFTQQMTPGQKRTDKLFDATACLALERYASAIESLICPRNEQWHTIVPGDPKLDEDDESKRWCEELTKLLFRYRYMPSANFSSQVHECFMELGAFGTTGIQVDDSLSFPELALSPAPVVYRSQPLDGMFISENASGQIDTVHRGFTLDARQAIQEFGQDKVSDRIRTAASKGATTPFEFIHCVYPISDTGPWAWNKPARARFYGTYVDRSSAEIVRDAFYTSMPFAVSRNVTAPREVYGRSVAMIVLPDIKMLNEIAKTDIRARQKVVDPPLLLADDGLGGPIDLTPGAVNYGHVNSQGRQLVHPLITGANLQAGDEKAQQLRAVIQDAFLVTLFQILVENKEMTAYEAALRAQEKGQLLAPTMGRQESEFLAPIIEREIDVLWRRGVIQNELDPMPEAMRVQRGAALKVVYTSPLSRLQRAGESVAVQRWLAALGPIAQINVGVVDKVDFDGAADVIADAEGVPQKARRKQADIDQIRAKRTQDANQQQLLAAAPVAAAAAKDAAQAHSIASQAPAPPALPVPA